MQHSYTEPFTTLSKDVHGNTPDVTLVSRKFQHTGNGKIYEVSSVVFNGDTDEWGYLLHDIQAAIRVHHFRSIANFFGVRAQTGTQRFIEVR